MSRRLISLELTLLEARELLAFIDYRINEADRRRAVGLEGPIRALAEVRTMLIKHIEEAPS